MLCELPAAARVQVLSFSEPMALCCLRRCCRRLLAAVDDYVAHLPSSARELQRRLGPRAADGDHNLACWMPAVGSTRKCGRRRGCGRDAVGRSLPVRLYCHGMNSDDPRSYLTLARTSDGDNYSLFSRGGTAEGSDVQTDFARVRIVLPGEGFDAGWRWQSAFENGDSAVINEDDDEEEEESPDSEDDPSWRGPSTPLIVCTDFTFATTRGGLFVGGGNGTVMTTFDHAAYGVAQNSDGKRSSRARIDLRGTPFAVACDFRAFGWGSSGVCEVSHQRQVVDLEGGGYQGGCGPPGAIDTHNRVGNGRAEEYWEKYPYTIPIKIRNPNDGDAKLETSFRWNTWNQFLTKDEEAVLRSYGPY